jgi:hypothetical protein
MSMNNGQELAAQSARVQAGDEQVVFHRVRGYEQRIYRVDRVRLTGLRMRRQLNSMDVCQFVLANFFAHAALGDFEQQSPRQLVALLATIAKNQVMQHVGKQRVALADEARLLVDRRAAGFGLAKTLATWAYCQTRYE